MKRFIILMAVFVIATIVFAQTPQTSSAPAPQTQTQIQPDSAALAKAAADSIQKVDTAFWAKADSIRKTFSKKSPAEIYDVCVGSYEDLAAGLLFYGINKKMMPREFLESFDLNLDAQQLVIQAAFTSSQMSGRCVELNGSRAKKWDAQITELARNDSALVTITGRLVESDSAITALVQTTLDSLESRIASLEDAVKKASFNDDAFKKALMRADFKKKSDPKWEGVFRETGLSK